MTPFNANDFLNGQPVVTRSGIAIEGLREVKYKGEGSYLTAMVNGAPAIWDMNGLVITGTDHALDLFMNAPIIYHWVKKKNIEDLEPADKKGYVKVIIS